MYKLLIVEDDQGISRGIMEQAQKWGLEVKCVEDFSDVLGEFKAVPASYCAHGYNAALF